MIEINSEIDLNKLFYKISNSITLIKKNIITRIDNSKLKTIEISEGEISEKIYLSKAIQSGIYTLSQFGQSSLFDNVYIPD